MADSVTGPIVHLDDDPAAASVIRRRRWLHRIVLGLLAVILGLAVLDGLALVDAYGVDTATVRASGRAGDGAAVELVVRYPSVTRPALASPFVVQVTREGGWDDGETVDVAVRAHYLEAWDVNGVLPSPESERSAGDDVVWSFQAPDGDVLTVRYDARIEPGLQSSRAGTVAVVEDGDEIAAVRFTTGVRP